MYFQTNWLKLSKALSVYESYCIGAGYPREAAATQTPSSSCKHVLIYIEEGLE